MPRDERRAQLLEVARSVFVAQGYHSALMDDIADAAGVSKPVLYQHFPGKLDLYLALIDTEADEMVARVVNALEGTTDNRQRVAATVRAWVEFLDDDSGAHRLLFENELRSEPVVVDRLEAAIGRCNDAITEVIAADAPVSPQEARLLAYALSGVARVGARWWMTEGRASGMDRERAIEVLAAVSWRGIAGVPRRT